MGHRIKKLISRIVPLILLAAALLFSLPALAEKNVVRVLLTKLELTDQVTLSLDGSYTVGDLSFQRGSQLKLSCAAGRIILYYEGMSLDMGKEAVLLRHAVQDGKENGLRINGTYPLYCGDLHLTVSEKSLAPVLHIPVEEYR